MSVDEPPAALLCATTSYPQHRGDASGRFVAHLNAEYAQAGWAPQVFTPKRVGLARARCPLYGFPLHEVGSFGPLFQSGGAPDWVQRHPLQASLSLPVNALIFTCAGRRWQRVAPQGARVAHWLVPTSFCFPRVELAHAHGGDVALLERLPFGASLARQLEQRVSAINFVSEDLKRRFEALLGRGLRRAVTTLPMGVESPEPCPLALKTWSEHKQREGKRLICTVGRLTEIKGHMSLLRALARLEPALRSKLTWVAAGDGPLRAQLRREATRLRVPLTLAGQLSAGERDALLACADLFVLPSAVLGRRAEGSPVALMEALSSGCPVVATRAGGVEGLLRGAPSELMPLIQSCEAGDLEGLASALEVALRGDELLSAEGRALRREALGAWGAQWRWSKIGGAHAEALREACALSSSPP